MNRAVNEIERKINFQLLLEYAVAGFSAEHLGWEDDVVLAVGDYLTSEDYFDAEFFKTYSIEDLLFLYDENMKTYGDYDEYEQALNEIEEASQVNYASHWSDRVRIGFISTWENE